MILFNDVASMSFLHNEQIDACLHVPCTKGKRTSFRVHLSALECIFPRKKCMGIKTKFRNNALLSMQIVGLEPMAFI